MKHYRLTESGSYKKTYQIEATSKKEALRSYHRNSGCLFLRLHTTIEDVELIEIADGHFDKELKNK